MCTFLSALVLRNGDLVCDPEHSDSHEDLVASLGLRDDQVSNHLESFCRVEFTPPRDHSLVSDLSKWNLKLDEENKPSWFSEEKVRQQLENLVSRHVVSDKRKLLLGDWWILVGEANVKVVKNSRIVAMYDSSQVGSMHDSSRVGKMYNSSQVGDMYDSSQVIVMSDSSQVGKMYDSSRVGEMYGPSQVGRMYDSSQVGEMYDSSRIINDQRKK